MHLNIINNPLVISNYSANTVVCMRCKRKSVFCTCYYLLFCAYSSSVELLLGLQQSVWWVFPPFSLIQNRTNDFCVPTLPISRKALHLPTQSFATVHAKLCIRPRKALHLPMQSFAFSPSPCFHWTLITTGESVYKKEDAPYAIMAHPLHILKI